MAVNKNFVVKNGLEVSTDLIFADASTEKVGIGSTIPSKQLDVIGGIGASELNITGVGTIVTLNGTTGIVTSVVGHSVQAGNLNVTGIASFTDVGPRNLYASGIITATSLDVIGTGNMEVGIITNVQGANLEYSGISTITTGIVTHLVANNLNVGGITSIRSGVVTHLAVDNLNVGGITSISSANIKSGVATHLAVNNLNVGGISTINNVIFTTSSGGIGATVGANVGVITYFGDGSNLTSVAGQGVGIGSTLGVVGYGFTFLNFVGTGSTFKVTGNTIDIGVGGGGGGATVTVSDSAPGTPSNGDLWYNSTLARLFIYYTDTDGSQWVDAAPFNQGGQFLSRYGDTALGAIGYTAGTTAQASVFFTGDPNTGLIQPSADHLGVVAGGTASLVVNPNGISVTGIITGNGAGLTGVASTDNIITTKEAKLLGGVRMEGFTTSATMNVTGVSTLRGDITLTGSQAGVTSIFFDASANTLQFQDLAYAKFGAGSDLSLFHDGTNSFIDNNTGDFFIRNNSNAIKIRPKLTEESIVAHEDGSVQLYYDNEQRIETLSVGSTVSGIQYATSFSGAFGSWTLGASGSDHYTFDGPGLTGAESDPTIYLQRGKRYNFVNSSGGHPFRIQSDPNGSTGTQYNDGITNNDAGNGTTLEWDVQFDAPDVLYYQCTSHGNMGGKIYIGNSGDSAVIGTGVTINNTGIDAGIGVGIITAKTLDGAASKVTVADESSDTSCNVVFTTAATGDLAPKTGTNLTFNSSSGALTASSFVGDLTGDASGSSGSCTGNAATATALATARNIGGVSFDGTAAINLPGVNQSGTQDTSGTAAIATAVTVADESSDTSSNVLFTTSATGNLEPKSGTNLTFNSSSGALTATSFAGDGSALTGLSAGGSGEFNTSISGATQYDVTASMATAYTANASSSHRTIVHSIHICNISASEVTISGEIQSSFSLAHTIPVPAGSAVELLKQPKVLGPSETIELQASSGSALEATIVVEYKEDTDYWDAAVDITSAATMTDIYTSSSYPSVVQSILLANDDGVYDVKARVAWTNGSNTVQSYLVYDMVIPADSTVEICEKPKYLASGYKLRAYANQANRLEITASGKQIT